MRWEEDAERHGKTGSRCAGAGTRAFAVMTKKGFAPTVRTVLSRELARERTAGRARLEGELAG